MNASLHRNELATSYLFLMIIAIVLIAYDAGTSLWAVNFSGLIVYGPDGSVLSLRESNPLIADADGKIDMTRLFALVPFGWGCCATLAFLYKHGQKPKTACYASFMSIYKGHKTFPICLVCLYAIIYVEIFVAIVNNPYAYLSLAIGLPLMSIFAYWLLFCLLIICPTLYTYHSALWRFLTDEAKAKYWYLAWPYKKGWMHEQNLELT